MDYKIYTVYDSKAEAYLPPFFMQSKGQAIRSFITVANDKTHDIGKYPEDYTLFELGEFFDESAGFTLYSTPVSLGVAIEFVKS